MKTIEERVVAFGKREIRHSNGILWEAGYREGSKVGYHFGATEQKKIDDAEKERLIQRAKCLVREMFLVTAGLSPDSIANEFEVKLRKGE